MFYYDICSNIYPAIIVRMYKYAPVNVSNV